MTTARNLIKNRIKAGNAVIGVGCYSAALTATDYNKVIKVGNTTSDPWLDFYHDVILPNPGNQHLPQVYSMHIDHANDYYVAVVERLYKHSDREYGDIDGPDQLEDTMSDFINDGTMDRKQFLEKLEDCWTCFGDYDEHQLWKACTEIRELISNSDTSYECGCDDGDCMDCNSKLLQLDLHTSNILYRDDGVLVINDPICNADMEDVDDLSYWADEMEIVD